MKHTIYLLATLLDRITVTLLIFIKDMLIRYPRQQIRCLFHMHIYAPAYILKYYWREYIKHITPSWREYRNMIRHDINKALRRLPIIH